MATQKRRFEDKLLARFSKIDPSGLRDYLVQLLSQKTFLETIFDHLAEGVVVTDDAQRIVYINRFARQLLVWPTQKQIQGEVLSDRLPPGPLQEVLAAMKGSMRGMEGSEFPFGEDGDRRLHLTVLPVYLREEGNAAPERDSMWVLIMTDVTERHRRMEEQARAQRLASLALLTSGVAHEIKNPLNSLNIHAQIILQQARESAAEGGTMDPRQVGRAAGVILEETARLTEVINEFISAARPQSPVLERKYVNRLIEDLARLFAPECEQSGIEMRVELEPELPPIDMDSHLIFQALRNLVRNAIDALTEPPGPGSRGVAGEAEHRKMLLIRTHLAEDHVEIEIDDNGAGIPEDSIDKIFEPYYTTKSHGTGLGLMIVFRIISQHRGSIFVDSHPGLGTRFVVTLPLAERPMRLLDSPAPTQPATSPTEAAD